MCSVGICSFIESASLTDILSSLSCKDERESDDEIFLNSNL
jgi:hypothetical protein